MNSLNLAQGVGEDARLQRRWDFEPDQLIQSPVVRSVAVVARRGGDWATLPFLPWPIPPVNAAPGTASVYVIEVSAIVENDNPQYGNIRSDRHREPRIPSVVSPRVASIPASHQRSTHDVRLHLKSYGMRASLAINGLYERVTVALRVATSVDFS